MNTRIMYALPCAGLVALAACASRQEQGAANPVAQQVQTPQRQSEQALERARDAQRKAADQEKKAVEAQRQVQKDQQQLVKDQEKARQEQSRARQLQSEASLATQQAARQARQSQQQASRALQQQAQQVQNGELTATGHVTQASADQLVLQPQDGSAPMTFTIGDDTRVLVDGRRAGAEEIRQGQDALVAYEVSGDQPTANLVQIRTGQAGARGGAEQQGTGNPQERGTGAGEGQQDTGSAQDQGTGAGSAPQQRP